MASIDLLIKTAESLSQISFVVKSAFDWGLISMVFFKVSVQPLVEAKIKVKVFVPGAEKRREGFSRLEVASLLKFQRNVVVIGLAGFVPVNWNLVMVFVQARSYVKLALGLGFMLIIFLMVSFALQLSLRIKVRVGLEKLE